MAIRTGSNAVGPIRDLEKISDIKQYLLHQSYRNYFMFVFGINSGSRIGDILPNRVLHIQEFINIDWFRVDEQKTKKRRKIYMIGSIETIEEVYPGYE